LVQQPDRYSISLENFGLFASDWNVIGLPPTICPAVKITAETNWGAVFDAWKATAFLTQIAGLARLSAG
jgi:hypothetical protein